MKKLGIERVMLSWRKNPLEVSCQLKRNGFYAIRKNRNNQCLTYFYRLCLYSSLSKTYSKAPGESWHIKSYVFLKKNPLEVSCQPQKECFLLPLEKTGIINVLCIFTDFDFIFLPKCTVILVKVGIERVMFILKKNPLEVSCQLSKKWFLCH